jgi:hypothetical protein
MEAPKPATLAALVKLGQDLATGVRALLDEAPPLVQ